MAIEAREFTEKDELIARLSVVQDGLNAITEEERKLTESEEALERLHISTKERFEKYDTDLQNAKRKKETFESQLDFFIKKKENSLLKRER